MTAYTIRVMTGQRKAGVCRQCRRPIEFRLNVRGHLMPFDAGAVALHTERDELTHVSHDVMSRDTLHFSTCPRRTASAASGARA